MNTTDIQTIVNGKITAMIDDGIITKTIEETVQNSVLKALESAVSSYDIEKIIKEKLKEEVSEELSTLSFKEYTNKVIESVCTVINIEQSKDLQDRVRCFYKDLFEEKKESVTAQEIINKYIEFMSEKNSEDYENIPDYAKISVQYNERYEWFDIKLTTPTKTYSYGSLYSNGETEQNEYYYGLTLSKCGSKGYHILSIIGGENKDRMTNQFSYRYYSGFEKFLLNLYLNQTEIKISSDDICENEEHSLGDW